MKIQREELELGYMALECFAILQQEGPGLYFSHTRAFQYGV